MTKFPDDYQMTRQEIDDLRQDTKNALKSPEYLALLSQIKRLDISKVKQLQDVAQIDRNERLDDFIWKFKKNKNIKIWKLVHIVPSLEIGII